jgi:hypothetical protein
VQRCKIILPHDEWVNKFTKKPDPKNIVAEYLDAVDWSHWCTFTTKWELTLPSARRMALKIKEKFCSPLSDMFQIDNPAMFWAAEPFDIKNGYHIHALIRTGASKKELREWSKKKYGRSMILDYQKGKGAASYCAKYITKKLSDYDYWL